jgi:hypothetical protein
LIGKSPQSKQSPIVTHNEHFPVEVLRTYQGRNFHHLSLTTQQLVRQSFDRLAFAPVIPENH